MGGLQRFEQRLEQMISSAFARTFRSEVQPVEISAALQREVDNNAQIVSRTRRVVPNVFVVELSGVDLGRLEGYELAGTFAEELEDHAATQGYAFPGPISIEFVGADDLTTGRFRIRSRAEGRVTGHATHTQAGRARAVLEVNGTRHPLASPGVVIGRGSEADLRINDPGISRRHAEFVVQSQGGGLDIEVRDLDSTNGITVDGHRVTRAALRDGSVVRAGSTTLTVSVVEDHHDRGRDQGAVT